MTTCTPPRHLPTALLLLGSITASVAPLAAQGFGTAAALGNGVLFLSESQNPYLPGRVHLFTPGADGWRVTGVLTAPEPAPLDRFGRSVSWAGGRLLVGATSVDSSRGAAYIFEQRDGTWGQTARLVPAAARAGESHGRIVKLLSPDAALVAAWGAADGRGAVTLFNRANDGTWSERQTLSGSDARPGDFFGSALAAEGNRLVIGAAQRDTSRGVAYVFERDASGQYAEVARLEGEGLTRGAAFGSAVAIMGDEVLVAAPGLTRSTGVVFRYGRDAAGVWQSRGQIAPVEGTPATRFGGAVERVGDELWIGAPGASGREGRVYRYAQSTDGAWNVSDSLGYADLDRGSSFGGLIVPGPEGVVIGIPGDDHGMGSAVVFASANGSYTPGDRLYVESDPFSPLTGSKADCTEGKVDQFGCSDVDLLAFLPIKTIGGGRGINLNDIWGWTDPESGREYAIVGRTDGSAFVDITNASNPRDLGSLPKTAASPASSWRDMKVYKDHAFIVADGAQAHGMQVFDLRRLRSVTSPQTFTEDAHYDRIHSAHNIVIDTTSGTAFAVGASSGGETCGGALHMIDIRTPTSPTFLGCFADPATGRQRTGYTHDAQCVLYTGPDADYAGHHICFNASETAIGIADVTDPASPRAISNAAYPNVGYAHQGWLSEDQRYFYMDDELDEMAGSVPGTRTLIWDLNDLDDPVLLKEYVSTVTSIDHNLYVRGNTMYQSNYTSGLRIFDITDPANPVPTGFFDTMPAGADTPTFAGSWSNYPYFKSGTIAVSSIGEGLFLLKKRERPLVP